MANVLLLDVRQTPYDWWVDIDGQPRYDGVQWYGLNPDVGVTVSLPWRTDVNGREIPFDFDDPLQISHRLTDSIQFEYYYSFDVMVKTRQDTFIAINTLGQQFTSHECGDMEIDTTLTVAMRKSIFASNVTGSFADAKISSVETPDLQLQSGLDWRVTPKVAIMQDVNQAVPIYNREQGDDYYTCDLNFQCDLTPGLVYSGGNLLPYEVYCLKTVSMTLLLEEPLDIGGQGDPIDPLDPPPFYTPPSLFDYLIMGLVFVVVIVVLIVVIKILGIIGSVVRRKR
jgi:hypothetical protein